MRIRLRTPEGATTIDLPDDATVAALREEITTKSFKSFDLKHGFPPRDLDLKTWNDDVKLADTGFKFNGEQLIVNPRENPPPSRQPVNPPSSSSTLIPPKSTQTPKTAPSANNLDDPPEIPVPSQSSTCILRVMPDDNSCLFRAISSAIMSDLDGTVSELRSIVAQRIQSNKDFYTEAVLDKNPDDYCRWISKESSWGGAIELGILADHFEVEITTVNVKDGQVYRFNEGKDTRCILVYSNIHYDVIALSPSDPPYTKADLPAELDIKIFSSYDDTILQAAQALCRVLAQRHYYTDTSDFSITCGDCGWKGNGEMAAQKHASSTGHYSFSEYS